ncbi:unnamed protein product [Effrenium voratum]|uniref:Palmitoyltransferase n=1 Tax=Effrenium voratum TaxID=2562239 RepID=A0AA36MRJ7_9DINO|nr:unnamed protein product [Effrenium voratum]
MTLRQREATSGQVSEEGEADVPCQAPECKTPECKAKHDEHNARCRSFLASPVWKCTTLVVVGFTPVFGVVLAMPHLLNTLGVAPWTLAWLLHYSFGAWISTQFLYNFIATQWTDPGGCKNLKPDKEVTGQFQLGGDRDQLALFYAPNWCTKCSCWKPPRSHHCSTCNRCILRMDHHCPFTGNCIGARNHGHFILFYIFAFIGLLYSLVLCVGAAYTTDHLSRWTDHIEPKWKEHKASLNKHFNFGLAGVAFSIFVQVLRDKGIEIVVQLVSTVSALVAVLGTGIPACHLACGNVTTMERLFPMKEYVQLQDQVYCPLGPGFYRQSTTENLAVIMGKRWWLRLLLPIPGELDSAILSPAPSKEGQEALQDRMRQVEEQGVKQEVRTCQDLGFDPGPAQPKV